LELQFFFQKFHPLDPSIMVFPRLITLCTYRLALIPFLSFEKTGAGKSDDFDRFFKAHGGRLFCAHNIHFASRFKSTGPDGERNIYSVREARFPPQKTLLIKLQACNLSQDLFAAGNNNHLTFSLLRTRSLAF